MFQTILIKVYDNQVPECVYLDQLGNVFNNYILFQKMTFYEFNSEKIHNDINEINYMFDNYIEISNHEEDNVILVHFDVLENKRGKYYKDRGNFNEFYLEYDEKYKSQLKEILQKSKRYIEGTKEEFLQDKKKYPPKTNNPVNFPIIIPKIIKPNFIQLMNPIVNGDYQKELQYQKNFEYASKQQTKYQEIKDKQNKNVKNSQVIQEDKEQVKYQDIKQEDKKSILKDQKKGIDKGNNSLVWILLIGGLSIGIIILIYLKYSKKVKMQIPE